MRILRRSVLALLLGLMLCSPWTSAAGSRLPAPGAGRQVESGLAAAVGRLWSSLVSLWNEEGCEIDPLGRCLASDPRHGLTSTAPLPPSADAGCEIDPLGHCAAGQSKGLTEHLLPPADEGCQLDPLGRCAAGR